MPQCRHGNGVDGSFVALIAFDFPSSLAIRPAAAQNFFDKVVPTEVTEKTVLPLKPL
jgi:hypothetical protein